MISTTRNSPFMTVKGEEIKEKLPFISS
jgi:hypothetical protein